MVRAEGHSQIADEMRRKVLCLCFIAMDYEVWSVALLALGRLDRILLALGHSRNPFSPTA